MPDPYKLQYNNMTLTYPGWNGYVGFENTAVVYNLYLQQQAGGTISANKLSGYNDEIVTLNNTPSVGYKFNSYSITGATLTSNQFAFNESDVTAKANFSVVTSQIYSNTNLSRTAKGSININISKAITAQPYWAIKFQQSGTYTSPAAWDLYLRFNNGSWNTRSHYTVGDYKGVRNGGTFTAANSNVASKTVDSSNLRYYKSVKFSTNGTYKFVGDRANNRVSAFINNTYLGYGTIGAITSITNLGIQAEQYGYIAVKNIYLGVFGTLAAAVNY